MRLQSKRLSILSQPEAQDVYSIPVWPSAHEAVQNGKIFNQSLFQVLRSCHICSACLIRNSNTLEKSKKYLRLAGICSNLKEGARIRRVARHFDGGMATIGPVKNNKIAN